MLTPIHFNGERRSVEADQQSPLLYVLRHHLQSKGTRFGCGSGHCGACHVSLNGRAVASCDTPLGSVANQTVETVEHLVASQVGAVVRQSFIDVQAAQCGYCINGILVSVIVMFQQTLQPDQDRVLAALDRHLCRCGAHSRILKAVDLAKQRLAMLKPEARVDV